MEQPGQERADMQSRQASIQALLFDTFGTTVDWKGSLTAYCARVGAEFAVSAAWEDLVVEWRSLYQPAIAPVREGTRLWAGFDELHRETLDSLLPKYRLNTLSDSNRDRLVAGWHLLAPWPDAVAGLLRMKQHSIVGAFSNGTVRQLIDMAKHSGLPWDVTLGADLFRTYKPAPAMYQGALALLGAPPDSVVLVAAHNHDLQAAAKTGMRTAFIYRPTEDPAPTGDYTFTANDFNDLAAQLAH